MGDDGGRGHARHLTACLIAGLVGTALQLEQRALWPAATYLAVGVASLLLLAIVMALRRRVASRSRMRIGALLPALACAALAFAVAGWRAEARLADRLDAALEGRDVVVTGLVAALPRTAPDGTQFEFATETATLDGKPVHVPARLSLGWYGSARDGELDAADALPPRIVAGERWRFTVRLKRPHGLVNPHGFDFERWLFEHELGATGSVRVTGREVPSPPQRLAVGMAYPIERFRQRVRDAIDARVHDPRTAGLLAALAIGDQSAIDRADWDVYRVTGVAHLMSISGLHVTMFAWLAGLLVGAVWRRSLRACLAVPAPVAARLGGVVLAAAYALVAGWGVPAQRTVLMLATVVLLQVGGLRWPWWLTLIGAAAAVVAVDPWALLQAGFWLSFVAVGLLIASDDLRARASSPASATDGAREGVGSRAYATLREAARTQVVATIGLAPLSIVFFQQVSLVGLVANALAIPLVTLVVTPLALAGVLLPALWTLAAMVAQGLNAALAAMAAPSLATWSVAVGPWWAQLAGLAAGVLAVARVPWRVRVWAVPLVLPMLWPVVERPEAGRFEAIALDVGQGSAVLVRTRAHLLLYDTGPTYARERDAGERVLVPLLRARGERHVDRLVLSHRDGDHIGGAAALLAAVPVREVVSSLPPTHPLLRATTAVSSRCEAGQRWQWDGVTFEVLHPSTSDYARPEAKPNAMSCVLRIADADARAMLLAGDIESAQEASLVAAHGRALASQVLLVAHHGSRTSSTPAWLDAVSPAVAVVQAGYRNRFGHPAPQVESRLRERNIRVQRNDRCGAWLRRADGTFACERERRRRYWFDAVVHPSPEPDADARTN